MRKVYLSLTCFSINKNWQILAESFFCVTEKTVNECVETEIGVRWQNFFITIEIVDRKIARKIEGEKKSFDCTRHLRKKKLPIALSLYMALLRCLWTVFCSEHKTSIRNTLNWPPFLELKTYERFFAKWILCNLTSSWIAAFVVNLCRKEKLFKFSLQIAQFSSLKNLSNSISFLFSLALWCHIVILPQIYDHHIKDY